MLLEKGYVYEPIDPDIRLTKEISRMRKEKNAVILSHYYVDAELQEIADYVGDSLGLSQQAELTHADVIVFIGVHFMAETAKILSPSKGAPSRPEGRLLPGGIGPCRKIRAVQGPISRT